MKNGICAAHRSPLTAHRSPLTAHRSSTWLTLVRQAASPLRWNVTNKASLFSALLVLLLFSAFTTKGISQACPCTTNCLNYTEYLTFTPGTYDFGYNYNSNCASASSFLWNFGDGSTSTDEYPSHTYQSQGTYNVHLQITDVNGCCSEYTIVIVYGTVPPSNVLCEPLCSGFVIDQGFEIFTDPDCDDPNFLSQFANNCITNWYPANGTADVLHTSNSEPGYEGSHYVRFVENEAVFTPFNIRKYRKYRLDLAAKFYSGPNNISGTLGVYAASGITPNPTNTGTPLYNSNLNTEWPKIGEMNLTGTSTWMTDCFEFELAAEQNEYSALLFHPYISNMFSYGKEIRMDKVRFTCELKIMRDIQAEYVSGGLFNFTPILNYQDVTGRIEYSWNFGDGQTADNQSNPSHTYTTAGVYNVCVTATDEDGCCETFCKEIRFDDGSCILEPGFTFIDASSPEGGNITSFINGNTVQDVKWQVKGNLVINTNITFINAELKMDDGASITVNPGSRLQITANSYFHGCKTMWKGIFFTGEGMYDIKNSTINDAETAINIKGMATVHLIGNTFDKNWISIDAFQSVYPIGYFADNTFDCTSTLLPAYTGQLLTNHGAVSYCGARGSNVGFFDLKLDYPSNGPDQSPNTFQNIRNGIIVFSSTANRCDGNQFINIIPFTSGDYTFSDQYSLTSQFKNNMLFKGHKGINITQPRRTFIMTGNDISDYNYKFNNVLGEICNIYSPINAFINISNNPNTSNSHLGYTISNGTATNILFKNNTLSNLKTGFYTHDLMARSIKSENNNITISSSEVVNPDAAISYYNSNGGDAYNNIIYLNGNSGQFLTGISNVFSGFGVVNENHIYDLNPNNPSIGVNVRASSGVEFYCNKIYDTEFGISFNNPCPKTVLETTELNNVKSYSLSLDNTEISPQPYNGNTFSSGLGNQSKAFLKLGSNNILENQFKVNTNDNPILGTLIPDIIITDPLNLEWFIGDDEQNNDKCEQELLSESNIKILSLEKIALGQVLNNEYYFQNKWTSQFQLYQLLDHDPSILDSSLVLQNFYFTNSEVKQYYDLYKAIYNLNSVSVNSENEIDSLISDFENNTIRLENLIESIYVTENTQLADSSMQIKSIIEDYQYQIENIYDSINSINTLSANALAADLNALSENEVFCTQFKTLLMAKIDLFRYGNDFVKTTYVDSLTEIAELCEFEYGIPVYLAQSLCEILNLNYEKIIDPCQSSRISKSIDNIKSVDIKLNPNPVVDKMFISGKSAIKNVSILDISGKELRSIYFSISNESIEVDCTSFGPGSYYIHILDAEGNIAVAKFIKI